VLAGHRSPATCVAFDGPGARIASGSSDQTVRVWDTTSGAELDVLTGAESTIGRVRFLPDGSGILGLAGARVHLWRLAGDRDPGRLAGHSSYVYGVAFLEDGRRLVSCAWDGTLRIWDVRARECLGARALGAPRALAVAAGPAGSWFATAEPGRVSLWSADTAERIAQLDWNGKGAVVALAASRDGELLASRSPGKVALWRTRERALERELACPGGDSTSTVALSGDGRWLAADLARSSIVVWERASGAEVARLSGHAGRVAELAFSPDGAWLASGGVDATVRLWDTRDWGERAVLAGHTDRVYALAFSPDGERLASGSNDMTVRIWSVPDGMSRGVLRGHRDYVYALAFSPDGECLASASGDASVASLGDAAGSRGVGRARGVPRARGGRARGARGRGERGGGRRAGRAPARRSGAGRGGAAGPPRGRAATQSVARAGALTPRARLRCPPGARLVGMGPAKPVDDGARSREQARSDATRILRTLVDGREARSGALLELVYDELRSLASRYLARERADHTLQPTALVHEAWMRMIDQSCVEWQGKAHFLGIAAQAMRRILVDHARSRARDKRAGARGRVQVDLEPRHRARRGGGRARPRSGAGRAPWPVRAPGEGGRAARVRRARGAGDRVRPAALREHRAAGVALRARLARRAAVPRLSAAAGSPRC
jgi:WD40 repeat protein